MVFPVRGFPITLRKALFTMILTVSGPEVTERLGASLAALLQPGDVLTLDAPLGGGKTTFVRGLARGLGIGEEFVSSPTFVIWQIYEGRLRLNHFDAYRLRSVEELEEIGFLECLEGKNEVVIVEWPQVAAPLLPPDRLQLKLDYAGNEDGRHIEIVPEGSWRERLAGWRFEG
jgi:tRNA threonylcarbamoyladenosine biosynthesis protein TsaE